MVGLAVEQALKAKTPRIIVKEMPIPIKATKGRLPGKGFLFFSCFIPLLGLSLSNLTEPSIACIRMILQGMQACYTPTNYLYDTEFGLD